ncbi:hypothetical protein RFI_11441, partial [Reticulomyxa filosa]
MKVILASSGICFEGYESKKKKKKSGEDLKQALAVETSISMKNQILFTCEGIRIRGGTVLLKTYEGLILKELSMVSMSEEMEEGQEKKEKEKDKEKGYVYLFDREYIRDPKNNSEDMLMIEEYRGNEPTLNEMKSIKKEEATTTTTATTAIANDVEKHPLSNSPSILVQMLPQFELQFQHHLYVCQFYLKQNQERIDACKRCFQQLKNQHKSLQVLDKHLISLSEL